MARNNNRNLIPEAKNQLDNFKMETANELGVNLQQKGYNGEITAKQAGYVGGEMVKKMISQAQQNLKQY